MGLLEHSGFQTLQFFLLVVICLRLFWSRSITVQVVIAFLTLGAGGLVALQLWGKSFPALPLFVTPWRILFTIFGAALLGEFLEEWRASPGGHALAHTLGIIAVILGTGLIWLNNWETASAPALTFGFLSLGYCIRMNRIRPGAEGILRKSPGLNADQNWK